MKNEPAIVKVLRNEEKEGKLNFYKKRNDFSNLKKVNIIVNNFKEFIENANQGIIIANKYGNHIYANQKAVEITGYSKEELLHTSIKDLVHPDEIQNFMEKFKNRFAEKNVPAIYEINLVKKDKTILPIEVNPTKITWNGEDAHSVIFNDLSEKRKIELSLVESEEKYKFISETIPCVVYSALADENSSNIFISGRNKELTGYANKEFMDKPELWNEIIHKDDKELVWTKIQEHRNKKTNLEVEYRIKTKDGKIKWILDKATPILDDNGEIKQINGFMQDITDIKIAKEKIKENEEKYRNIVNLYPDGISIIDLKGYVKSINTSFLKITGYTENEIINKHITRLPTIDIKFFPEYLNLFKKMITGKINNPIIFKWRHKTGEVRLGEARYSLLEKDGKKTGLQIVLKDITEQKKTEELIKSKENELRIITNSTPDVIFMVNKKGKLLYLNKSVKKLFGYEPEEIIGTSFIKYIPKKELPKYWKQLKIATSGKDPELFNSYIKTKNGEVKPVEILGSYVEKSGEKIGLGTIRDISERMESEEKIKESEKKYRNLIENSPDSIITTDLKGNITSCNKAALKILDYLDEDELLEKNFKKIVAMDKAQMPSYFKIFNSIIRGKQLDPFEVQLTKKDGAKIYVETHISPLKKNKKIIGIQAITRDISGRKKAEKEVFEKKEELEILNKINSAINRGLKLDEVLLIIKEETGALFNTSGTSVYLLSDDKKNLIAKKSGMSDKQVKYVKKISGINIINAKIPLNKGSIYFDLIKNSKPRLINDKKKINQMAKDYTENTVAKKIAPTIIKLFKINSTMSVPLITDQECVGLLDISRDYPFTKEDLDRFSRIANQLSIAIKKIKTENELEQLNIELTEKVKERTNEVEDLLKQKDEFINILGHDLKNPLTPMMTLVPIINKKTTDPEIKEMLGIINKNVHFMKDLVTKTLELAKLNSPNTTFDIEEVNLLDEINKIIEKNQIILEKNKIIVDVDLRKDQFVKADKLRLSELFDNFLTNSIKYSQKDTSINIKSEEIEGFIKISIKDKGVGLTKEQQENIFSEFYKVDKSRGDYESSGLGLPICKKIVEKHGGKLWVESKGPGKGSTFNFLLKKVDG